jgi:hypothetical protein
MLGDEAVLVIATATWVALKQVAGRQSNTSTSTFNTWIRSVGEPTSPAAPMDVTPGRLRSPSPTSARWSLLGL